MNICTYCLIETEADDCCRFGTTVSLDTFIRGVDLAQLKESREHWNLLPALERPAHERRLAAFDAIIAKVEEARA